MAIAGKGCCPSCMEACAKDGDGFYSCLSCDWRFVVGVTLDGSRSQMVIEQPTSTYLDMKKRVVVGVRGVKAEGE